MKLEFISIQYEGEIISVKKGEEGGLMIVNLNMLFVFVDG